MCTEQGGMRLAVLFPLFLLTGLHNCLYFKTLIWWCLKRITAETAGVWKLCFGMEIVLAEEGCMFLCQEKFTFFWPSVCKSYSLSMRVLAGSLPMHVREDALRMHVCVVVCFKVWKYHGPLKCFELVRVNSSNTAAEFCWPLSRKAAFWWCSEWKNLNAVLQLFVIQQNFEAV